MILWVFLQKNMKRKTIKGKTPPTFKRFFIRHSDVITKIPCYDHLSDHSLISRDDLFALAQ